MPKIDLTVDAAKGLNALGQFGNALDSVNNRIKELNVTQATFNSKGELLRSTVKHQISEFGTLTQTISRTGKVLKSTYTNDLDSARKAAERLSKMHERLANQGNILEQGLHRIGRNLVQFASYRSFDLVVHGIREGISAAKDFQIQLSLIRTLSQENQQSFVKFGQDVRNISDISGIDIKDVGKAFYDAISNQIAKGADVAPFIKTSTDLARVTGSELPDSVNLLSSAINAYGLSVTDAERLSAIFFRTIDEGRVVASELANTFGRVAVLGSNLGVSIEDLNAVIAVTTQKGFKTSDALTLLTNLLIKLEKPTEATRAFFESLGVDSGEAAIKLLGFNGVLRKMVEAVRSGQVDVSTFFDEIRGRKQFGVFEQSIDQIEGFSNKLKNTTAVMHDYSKALAIRGESPADLLVKETNKLANVFKVDLGQAILKNVADFVVWSGGANRLKNLAKDTTDVLKLGAGALTAYTITAIAGASANAGLAASFMGVAGAAGLAVRVIAPLAAVYAGFKIGQDLFGGGQGNDRLFGKIDPNQFNSTADAVERVKQKFVEIKAIGDPFASITAQNEKISSTFKDVLGFVARANVANNKFLDEAKSKSKELTEAIKVGFAGYTDIIKSRIGEIKKGITEATNEIEKSQKSMLGFKESLDDIIFDTQLKFANDQMGGQKIQLTENRIAQMTARAAELFGQGTPEAVNEARQLFDQIAKLEQENFDRRIELQKQFMGQQDPINLNLETQNVLYVETTSLQNNLNKLLELRNQLESKYVALKEKDVATGKDLAATETERLRKLEMAFKQYEQLDVFDKAGKVKPEFRDSTGKFDPAKLQSELGRLEEDIRESGALSFAQRFELEILLSQKRQALNKEVAAQERSDYLKTTQDRILSQEEELKAKLNNLKKEREARIAEQTKILTAFGEKPGELAAFANQVSGSIGRPSKTEQADLEAIAQSIKNYREAVKMLFDNKVIKDGVGIARPEDIARATELYERALQSILALRDKAGSGAGLSLQDANGREITPGGALDAVKLQAEELQRNSLKLFENLSSEKSAGGLFEATIIKPLEGLKTQFPELAETAKTSTIQMGQSFRDLANGGVQDLINQLREVQRLMNVDGLGKQQGVADTSGTYAASGGMVGMFPGQPRGVDRYPVWAAKGEYIVNAQSAQAFLPMLEAINRNRSARYMASGGMVGDTNIGDINVTVNGGPTNSDTGRAIANKLERELRRRSINLKRR